MNHNENIQIFSRIRLAPLTVISIPRLELMAVLLSVRLLNFIERMFKFEFQKKYIFSDSKCVLFWLKNGKVHSIFVENRVKEIWASKNVEFRYVKSEENAADLGTRWKNCRNRFGIVDLSG